jgi:hypothetical protein
VKERFYVRPAGFPVIAERRSSGLGIPFAVELVCADPRRYLDTATSVTLNSGNSFTATCPNWTSLIGVHVFPTLTITMSGAGASNFTFNFASDSVANLVLDLSGLIASDVVVYDCATGQITVNGLPKASLRTSGVATAQPFIPGGGSSATATNTTGVTSVVIGYRQARG